MRKVLTFLGASVCLAWVLPVMAQIAPPEFSDVPTDHWAYDAVESLRAKNILVGYPDGYFRGKRTLSRYEFAVALKRALDSIQLTTGPKGDPGPQGPKGDKGEKGEAGQQGPTGIAPEELATLKKLADEFKAELANQGVNINALNAKFDRLAQEVAAIKAEIAKMPKVSGTMFAGIRSDRARGPYVDADGRPSNSDLKNEAVVVHALELGVTAHSGDTVIKGSVVTDNYKNYLNGSFTEVRPLDTMPRGDVWINQLTLQAPFEGVGREGSLTIGRLPFQVSPLTLWKPDVDSYFNNTIVDDGMYRMDGLTLDTKLGSLGVQAFAGSFKTVIGTQGTGGIFNAPIAGVSGPSIWGSKPTGIAVDNPVRLSQIGGLAVSLPIRVGQEGSYLRGVGILGTGGTYYWYDDYASAPSRGYLDSATNVAVLGADTKVNLSESVSVEGAWSKTLTGGGSGQGRDIGNLVHAYNNAFLGKLGYTSGNLGLTAGYKYVDPMFYAPGYWGRVGNWINPTNVQGPMVRLNYQVSPTFAMSAGGDFLTAARDWASAGTLGKDDEIQRVQVGLRWAISDAFQTTVDWEGVYWKLANVSRNTSGSVYPVEHYITLGTGYELNDTTKIKLGYQIGQWNGKGFLTGGMGSGYGYNYNTFTTQVSVKF